MKTTLCIYLTLLFVIFSCTSTTKEANAIDSLKTNTDTLSRNENFYAASTATDTSEPPSIFTYSEETFTEDERESAVTHDLIELLREYGNDNYLAIKNEYFISYQEEVDAGEFMDVNETKTKTWFYDSLNRLRCFVMDYQYRVGNEGFSNTSTIYLFAGDSLMAVYEDKDESIQMASKTHTRVVATRCPACGTFTSAAMSDTYQVSELDLSFLEKISTTFFKENDPNFGWLHQLKVKQTGDNYVVTQEEQGVGNTPKNVEYTINRYLFDTYIEKP